MSCPLNLILAPGVGINSMCTTITIVYTLHLNYSGDFSCPLTADEETSLLTLLLTSYLRKIAGIILPEFFKHFFSSTECLFVCLFVQSHALLYCMNWFSDLYSLYSTQSGLYTTVLFSVH